MTKAKKKERMTIIGIVVPNDWDQGGHLAEVVLCGTDESEIVVSGPKQQDLFRFCHHRLRVTGTLCQDDKGRRSLDMDGYAVLGDETDSGYESGFRI